MLRRRISNVSLSLPKSQDQTKTSLASCKKCVPRVVYNAWGAGEDDVPVEVVEEAEEVEAELDEALFLVVW